MSCVLTILVVYSTFPKTDLQGTRKDQLLYATSVLKSNLPNDPNLALLASNPTKRELHITLVAHKLLYTSS